MIIDVIATARPDLFALIAPHLAKPGKGAER